MALPHPLTLLRRCKPLAPSGILINGEFSTGLWKNPVRIAADTLANQTARLRGAFKLSAPAALTG